jgi:hypothetical protein
MTFAFASFVAIIKKAIDALILIAADCDGLIAWI